MTDQRTHERIGNTALKHGAEGSLPQIDTGAPVTSQPHLVHHQRLPDTVEVVKVSNTDCSTVAKLKRVSILHLVSPFLEALPEAYKPAMLTVATRDAHAL